MAARLSSSQAQQKTARAAAAVLHASLRNLRKEPAAPRLKPSGGILGEGHPCRPGRMVESPVRLMQRCDSALDRDASSTSQPSPSKPGVGQGESRVLRRKWPVSRTPPCISSAPCPILPTWRCCEAATATATAFSPMLPCASLCTPAICDPFLPVATARLLSVRLSNQPPFHLEYIKSRSAPFLPSSPLPPALSRRVEVCGRPLALPRFPGSQLGCDN
jgi:hypothetical protein